MNGGAARVNSVGQVLAANDALAAWLGTSAAEVNDSSLPCLLGRRHPSWESALRAFLQGDATFDSLELEARNGRHMEKLRVELFRDGATCFVRLKSVAPMMWELEEMFPESCWARFVGHPMGQRLLRAETQVENLMNRWPGIVFSQRPDLSFVFVSPKIEDLTGVGPSEWRRQSRYFWEVVHEADAEAVAARIRNECERASGMTSTFRIRHVQTGQVTYLWEHRRALFSGNGLLLGFEGIWLDVTRQTIAERRLLNLSWSENLGKLSMGLAHDFCNMMTGIVGLSEVLQTSVEPGPVQEGLGMIRKTAFQASQLAHRIRSLQHGTPGEKSFQDLNQAITTLGEVLVKVMPSRVKFHTQLMAGQLPIYVDTVELQQVIINLVLNAVDAMPEGGKLTVETGRHEQLPEAQHLQGTLPRLPAARLSVRDTGTGVPAHALASIFDPFFTTKPLGKGSGLGLYNARLFVEKHGAAISVETREGAGTTFHMWFAEADFTEADQAQQQSRLPLRHTLLVVSAAGQVLDSTTVMLRRHGYYVVPVHTATEASEALLSPQYQFTGVLLLCTSAQPEDLALCQRLRSQKLRLNILLGIFGCNQDELDAALLRSVDGVLPLDSTANECVARLKSLLDGERKP